MSPNRYVFVHYVNFGLLRLTGLLGEQLRGQLGGQLAQLTSGAVQLEEFESTPTTKLLGENAKQKSQK